MLEEFPAEALEMPDERFQVWIDVLKKILREVLQKLVEMPNEMRQKIHVITGTLALTGRNVYDTIFKHCFRQDIFDGTVSSDERDFVVMMKNIPNRDKRTNWDERTERTKAIDKYYMDCCKKTPKENGNS